MKFTLRVLTFAAVLVLASAQLGENSFEFFDFTNEHIRPNSNKLSATTPRYEDNFFLSNRQENQGRNQFDGVQACNSYWAIYNDGQEAQGQLRVPTGAERNQIQLRVVLSVAARLPSVRISTTFSLIIAFLFNAWNFLFYR